MCLRVVLTTMTPLIVHLRHKDEHLHLHLMTLTLSTAINRANSYVSNYICCLPVFGSQNEIEMNCLIIHLRT